MLDNLYDYKPCISKTRTLIESEVQSCQQYCAYTSEVALQQIATNGNNY